MNKCSKVLPEGWTQLDKIDLKENKKQFWIMQGISILLAVLMIVAGCFIVHPSAFFGVEGTEEIIAIIVLIVGAVVYIVLHELTHGVFLSAFTRTKPKFGFVGWAAYCGNEAYCNKPCYAVVALSPLVVWGIVFGVLNVFFHDGIWFWVIWFLQTMNVAGAAGDLFVSFKLLFYPKEILVQDTGLAMTVYRRMTQEEMLSSAENTEERL